jgi:large subunit ribosomal protein L17
MLRNMVTSLLTHERIETTLEKAKEVRKVADRLITLAKRGDLAAHRQAMTIIRKKSVAHKLFAELAGQFSQRQGGYTRVLRLGNRPGDNASMAIIELTEKSAPKEVVKAEAKPQKKSVLQTAREAITGKSKKTGEKKAEPKKSVPKKAAKKETTEAKPAGKKPTGAAAPKRTARKKEQE